MKIVLFCGYLIAEALCAGAFFAGIALYQLYGKDHPYPIPNPNLFWMLFVAFSAKDSGTLFVRWFLKTSKPAIIKGMQAAIEAQKEAERRD